MYDSDPVPGDPYEVARLGKELRGMADEIDKQARNIRALSTVDGWDSDAGRAFHDTARDTAGRLQKAYDRYDDAATAMGTRVGEGESDEYATELNRAQQMADKALREFRAAESDHKSATKALEPYTGTVPSKDDHMERRKQQKRKDVAADLMAKARSEIESAKDIRDDAADRAAKKIKNVIHHDGVHDPGGVMDWIADHADWFSAAAAVLAVIALAAAVILTGGIAGAVIAAVAAMASGTALTGHLYDTFARGGKFDAMKIGVDVLGVLPGLGALKGLTAGAKGARSAAGLNGVWGAFTNGFGVKRINDGVRLASKMLAKKGIATPKFPAGGWDPVVVTRYIKGFSLGKLTASSVSKLADYLPGNDTPHHVSPPPGDAGPRPEPNETPSPPGSPGVPSPTPQPKPSSSSFHAALAPTG
ncbi:putative T7SS-secreted protein [Streptomyces tsukubensis]